MADIIWEKAVITQKGFALQSKSMVGVGGEIKITSVKAGAGVTTNTSYLQNMTDVAGIKQILTIQQPEYGVDTTIIPVYLSNDEITEAYNLRQVGFYAEDPDEGEILYAIAQNAEARRIPAAAEAPGFALVWNFHFTLSNETNITVKLNPASMARLGDLPLVKGTGTGSMVNASGGSKATNDYAFVPAPGSVGKRYNSVLGKYAKEGDAGTQNSTSTGDAVIVGNGTPTTPSNAFRVTMGGESFGLAAHNSSGADYAEYFEWQDGNPAGEDRYGLFVTLDGEQITTAGEAEYILGVVSKNPSVIGNADEDYYHKWIRDEYGAPIIENGSYVLNPAYNPEEKYVHRKDRQEWAAVGMIGVVPVRDDGTCQVNGYCKCGPNGIATASETGYRVIKRINPNLVKIVLK